MTKQIEAKATPKRRPKGTGSIKEYGGSIYIAYHPYRGSKQVQERVGRVDEGVTRQDAEDLLALRFEQAKREHEGTPISRILFKDVAAAWRSRIESNTDYAESTKDKYRVALDCHLIPAFGNDPMKDLTPSDIETYIERKLTRAPGEKGAPPVRGKVAAERSEGLKRTAVKQQLSTLKRLCTWSVREGFINTNPMDSVDYYWAKKSPEEKQVLEREEVRAIVKGATSDKDRLMILLLAGLGLRIGELLALRIEDYNPVERSITISGSMARVGGKVQRKEHGKTAAAHRTLKLSESLAARVEQQIQEVEGLDLGLDKTPLFPTRFKNFMSRGSFVKVYLKPALEAARLGDRGITPHWFRHTFASENIAKGMALSQLSYAMGHASSKVTLDVYATYFRRHQAEIMDMSNLYDPSGSEASQAEAGTLVDVNDASEASVPATSSFDSNDQI
jgi:integrase